MAQPGETQKSGADNIDKPSKRADVKPNIDRAIGDLEDLAFKTSGKDPWIEGKIDGKMQREVQKEYAARFGDFSEGGDLNAALAKADAVIMSEIKDMEEQTKRLLTKLELPDYAPENVRSSYMNDSNVLLQQYLGDATAPFQTILTFPQNLDRRVPESQLSNRGWRLGYLGTLIQKYGDLRKEVNTKNENRQKGKDQAELDKLLGDELQKAAAETVNLPAEFQTAFNKQWAKLKHIPNMQRATDFQITDPPTFRSIGNQQTTIFRIFYNMPGKQGLDTNLPVPGKWDQVNLAQVNKLLK